MLVWLENAYSRPFLGGFGAHFPNDVTHRPNPKKDRPWAEPRHLSNKPRKSVARFELGVWTRKKGQDRTGQEKKSQKGYISPICGEAPTEAMYMKICVVGDVLVVITYAKFQNEIFRGYNFTGGRIFHFSYWFWILNATALPVISSYQWPCWWHFTEHTYYTTGFHPPGASDARVLANSHHRVCVCVCVCVCVTRRIVSKRLNVGTRK